MDGVKMNNAFWCEKCGQSLAVCDGEGVCESARRRSTMINLKIHIDVCGFNKAFEMFSKALSEIKLRPFWSMQQTEKENEKMESEFKVGDLVKVVSERPVGDDEYTDDMVKYLGKTMKISSVYSDGMYRLEGAKSDYGFSWIFREAWLTPAFKFEIGENVKVHGRIGHILERYESDDGNLYIVKFESAEYQWAGVSYSLHCHESHIEKYTPELPEEKQAEKKKHSKFDVLKEMVGYFDILWKVEGMSLNVAIGTDNIDSGKKKEFDFDESEKAFRWLVKQACKMDEEFKAWYENG